ncbi:MAG: cytochrome c biogenesis protein CcdA [Treponema sp.]|nr:cytochrome c biogenesis protein CcdA [Treponema sp.]
MMTEDLSLLLVFGAGLLSFLSPCVLPLIPSYLGILGGVGLAGKNTGNKTEQNASASSSSSSSAAYKPQLLLAAASFALGFSIVFITLGILISTTFFLMGGISRYINWAAGIVVIVLGLNVIFDFLSFLNYENRPFLQKRMNSRLRGMPQALIAGMAFGTGWTPCIGPVLAGILLMAGQSGSTAKAVFYLAVYSLGLALPFLVAAMFFDFFLKQSSRLRTHLILIQRISGILLITIGIMILTGRYSALNILIQRMVIGYIGWAETKALPFRLLADALAWLQNF